MITYEYITPTGLELKREDGALAQTSEEYSNILKNCSTVRSPKKYWQTQRNTTEKIDSDVLVYRRFLLIALSPKQLEANRNHLRAHGVFKSNLGVNKLSLVCFN